VVTASGHGVPEELIPVPTYTGLKKPVAIVPAEIQIDHFPDTMRSTPQTHRGITTEDEVGISQHKILHPYYDGLPCPTALWTTINSTYPTNVASIN
jgi:hypothetical protein